MSKGFERNEDRSARDDGRMPSKGAMAAERASAGLGATDHDAELMEERIALEALRAGLRLRSSRPSK